MDNAKLLSFDDVTECNGNLDPASEPPYPCPARGNKLGPGVDDEDTGTGTGGNCRRGAAGTSATAGSVDDVDAAAAEADL